MPDYDRDENVKKLRARTYEDAKNQLFDLYKYDYSITDKRQVLTGGFLGFGQKEEVEVSYIVKKRAPAANLSYSAPVVSQMPVQPYYGVRDPSDAFLKNRDELLKKNAETAALPIQQVKNLEKTMEKMRD